jgi:hypothetical protein
MNFLQQCTLFVGGMNVINNPVYNTSIKAVQHWFRRWCKSLGGVENEWMNWMVDPNFFHCTSHILHQYSCYIYYPQLNFIEVYGSSAPASLFANFGPVAEKNKWSCRFLNMLFLWSFYNSIFTISFGPFYLFFFIFALQFLEMVAVRWRQNFTKKKLFIIYVRKQHKTSSIYGLIWNYLFQ